MNPRILFVDDDANVLAAYQRSLRKAFSIDVASGGEAGLATIAKQGPYAVIVADMQMPGMNGVQFLIEAETIAPDSVRIMLTGNADQRTATDAVNQGHVFRFLNKPCPAEEIILALKAGVRQYALVTAERELLEKTLGGSIKIMTEILSAVAPESFQHSTRLRDRALQLASRLNVQETWELEIGVTLSKLGHVTIPPELLSRARAGSKLTDAEREMLDRVPETGAAMLANIPRLEGIAEIVASQNRNFDGAGSPHGSPRGAKLPLGARILKVLNEIDTLFTSSGNLAEVFIRMEANSGAYDPEVLARARECFGPDAVQPGGECSGKPCSVDIDQLCEGDRLVFAVETDNKMVIAPADTVISRTLLRRLRNFSELGNIKEPFVVLHQTQAAASTKVGALFSQR